MTHLLQRERTHGRGLALSLVNSCIRFPKVNGKLRHINIKKGKNYILSLSNDSIANSNVSATLIPNLSASW